MNNQSYGKSPLPPNLLLLRVEGLLNPRMKRLVMAGQIHTDNTKVGPGTYNIGIDDVVRKSPRVSFTCMYNKIVKH